MTNRFSTILGGIFILTNSLTIDANPQNKQPLTRPDDIIIQANSFTIRRKDLESELNFIFQKIGINRETLTPEQLRKFEKAAQKSLVRNALLRKAAEEIQIDDLPTRVEQKLKEYREAFPSEKDFLTALEAQHLTLDDLKKQIIDSIKIQELIRQRLPQAPPPNEEVIKNFFQENKESFAQPEMIRVQHISVLVPQEASKEDRDAKRQALEAVRQRVILGEDFSKLAREISKEKDDGDLGWIKRGQLGKEFDEVAFKLKPGQVSELFTTDRGYHFVFIRDRREAQKPELNALKPQIEKFLIQEAQLESIDKLVQQLEKQEKIIYIDALTEKTPDRFSKNKDSSPRKP